VTGLDNFQVGMPDALPAAGSAVDPTSYHVCGTASVEVANGKVVVVDCSPSCMAATLVSPKEPSSSYKRHINNLISDVKARVVFDCSPSSRQFRYVIVQSLDTFEEHLCIGEVAVASKYTLRGSDVILLHNYAKTRQDKTMSVDGLRCILYARIYEG